MITIIIIIISLIGPRSAPSVGRAAARRVPLGLPGVHSANSPRPCLPLSWRPSAAAPARRCALAAFGRASVAVAPRGQLRPPTSPCPSPPRREPAATTEAAWHRRARRGRQAARALLAVERARRVLAAHHGGGQAGDGGAVEGMQRRYDEFWEGVPRGINLSKGLRPWSCACGQIDNWICRKRCWKCGRDQPLRIAADARRIAERGDKRGDRTPSRGRSRERRPRGQDGTQRQGNVQSGKTYADAAKRADELQRQLAAEKRSREELERKLSAATASAAKKANTSGPETSHDDEDEDDGECEKREQRLRQLSVAIEALEAVVGNEDEKLLSLKTERSALEKARQAGKPLKAKLLALDRKIEKKKSALAKLETETGEAWKQAEMARKLAESLDEKQEDLQKTINELEADRKQMLREELEEEGTDMDAQHWEGTVEAIRARTAVPGVDGALANAIAATLEQLRQQCSLLPAQRPQAEPAPKSRVPPPAPPRPATSAASATATSAVATAAEATGTAATKLTDLPTSLGPNGKRATQGGIMEATVSGTTASSSRAPGEVAVTIGSTSRPAPADAASTTPGTAVEGVLQVAQAADCKPAGGPSDDVELLDPVVNAQDELEDALATLTPEQQARVRTAVDASYERRFLDSEARERRRDRERSPRSTRAAENEQL